MATDAEKKTIELPPGTHLYRGPVGDSDSRVVNEPLNGIVLERREGWSTVSVALTPDPKQTETRYVQDCLSASEPTPTLEPLTSDLAGRDIFSILQFTRDTVIQVLPLIDQMDRRLQRGERGVELTDKVVSIVDFNYLNGHCPVFAEAARQLGCTRIKPTIYLPGYYVDEEQGLVESLAKSYPSDLIVLNTIENDPFIFAQGCKPPIITARQGLENVSRALADFYSVWKFFGRINNLHVLAMGNLADETDGITSFLHLLNAVGAGLGADKRIELKAIAPRSLGLPFSLADNLKRSGIGITEFDCSDSEIVKRGIREANVVYYNADTRLSRTPWDTMKKKRRLEELRETIESLDRQIRDESTIMTLCLVDKPRTYDFQLAVDMALMAAVAGRG